MNSILRNKYVIILLCGCILMFFNLNVKSIPLNNRGVVVGLGIDKAENGEGYKITAQTILSTEGGGTTKSEMATNFYILESEGVNIVEAMQNISNQSAITPAFKDCILVIFGKDLLKNDIDYLSEFLFTDNIISDHAILVRAEEKAGESLKKKIPNTTVLTFHLSRLLNSKYAKLGINNVSLRSYSVTRHTETINILPLFRAVPAESSQKKSESGSEGCSASKDEYHYFDVYTTSVISDKGIIDLSLEEASGLSILLSGIREGSIEVADGGRRASYDITSINTNLTYSSTELCLSAKIKVQLKLNEIVDSDKISSAIIDSTPEDVDAVKNLLDGYVAKLFEFSQRENLDIIGIYEGFYAKRGKRWKDSVTEDFLQKTTLRRTYEIHII